MNPARVYELPRNPVESFRVIRFKEEPLKGITVIIGAKTIMATVDKSTPKTPQEHQQAAKELQWHEEKHLGEPKETLIKMVANIAQVGPEVVELAIEEN